LLETNVPSKNVAKFEPYVTPLVCYSTFDESKLNKKQNEQERERERERKREERTPLFIVSTISYFIQLLL
jgi:hypothetical protein